MGAREDFLGYRNTLGFFSNSPGGSSGNDLLFTAEAREVMIALRIWTDDDQKALIRSIVMNAQIEPGLYRRPGWGQDQEAQDDYVGLACISSAIAGSIQDYGRRHWWYFNTSPMAKWWEPIFWRWPALIAHVSFQTGRRPNLLLRIIWALAISFGPKKGDLDSFKLAFLMIDFLLPVSPGWLGMFAVRSFNRKLSAAYPGGMKQVYTEYFGAEHPIAKYCPECW